MLGPANTEETSGIGVGDAFSKPNMERTMEFFPGGGGSWGGENQTSFNTPPEILPSPPPSHIFLLKVVARVVRPWKAAFWVAATQLAPSQEYQASLKLPLQQPEITHNLLSKTAVAWSPRPLEAKAALFVTRFQVIPLELFHTSAPPSGGLAPMAQILFWKTW